jgi:hypothetical protein
MSALTRCKCGHAHDNSASCEGVASSYREAQALIAADVDFASRALDLLMAYHDALRHARVHQGHILLSCLFDDAAKAASREMENLRCTVASERELWDGVDPTDVHLMSVSELIAEYQCWVRS